MDTRHWNLSAPKVLALGFASAMGVACGPAVGLEDTQGGTEGGTDSEAGTDTRDTIVEPPETDTNPSTMTLPPECELDTDCNPGFECINNECVEEDYDCYEYGDCYCYYGHCQPPYDCFDDEECGPGGQCEYGYCEILEEVRDCDAPLELLPVPIPAQAQGAISLSFVEADGNPDDDELLVGTEFGAILVNPEADEPVVTLERPAVLGGASGDFDGDGALDLALVEPDQITISFGFGSENFEVAGPLELSPTQILGLGWHDEGDGDDLALLTAEGEVLILSSTPERELQVEALESANAPYARVSVVEYNGSPPHELVAEPDRADFSTAAAVLYESGNIANEFGQNSDHPRELAVVSSGEDTDTVVWTTAQSDWTYLDAYIGEGFHVERAIYQRFETMATRDVDGDGTDNVVFVGDGLLAAVDGSADTFNCVATAPLDTASPSMVFALGDLDGDGRDGIVLLGPAGQLEHYAIAFAE